MPHIKLELDFLRHPKSMSLCQILGDDNAVIYLLKIWIYCGKFFKKDGLLRGKNITEIEIIAGWKGEQGKLIKALLACGEDEEEPGYLLKTAKGYKCHNWNKHQGHIATFSERSKMAARARWGGDKKAFDPKTIPANIYKVLIAYKVALGIDANNTAWNEANFKRYYSGAKELTQCFKDDLKEISKYIMDFASDYKHKGLDWTLTTAAKHAWIKNIKPKKITQKVTKSEKDKEYEEIQKKAANRTDGEIIVESFCMRYATEHLKDDDTFGKFLKAHQNKADKLAKYFGVDLSIKLLKSANRATNKKDFDYLVEQIYKHHKDWRKGK